MASSRPGHKSILLCDKGTLATTPVNPLYMGFRGSSKMNITPFKGIKEYRGGELRNMKNFAFSAESFQCTLLMLKSVIGWLNGNCDIQVESVKQSASTADVWKFIGNYLLGLGFEYVINGDKRSLTIKGERAFPNETAKALIDESDSNTLVTTAVTEPRGMDTSLVRTPFYLAFESPKTTALALDPSEILDRSLTIKSKGKKSIDNMDIVDYLTFELMLKVRNSSIAKMVLHMARDMAASVYVKESNGSTFFDAFDFAPNTLIQNEEFENTDDDRIITMKFARDVELFDLTWLYGAANGGDASDSTGVKGGTLKVGY